MRKHKFNRPLTVAFTEKMYSDIKSLSDTEEVSMAEWVRESLCNVIEYRMCDPVVEDEQEKDDEVVGI